MANEMSLLFQLEIFQVSKWSAWIYLRSCAEPKSQQLKVGHFAVGIKVKGSEFGIWRKGSWV